MVRHILKSALTGISACTNISTPNHSGNPHPESIKEDAPGKTINDGPTPIGTRNVHVNEPHSRDLHRGIDVALFDIHMERVEVYSHIWLVDQVGQLGRLSGGVDEIGFKSVNGFDAERNPSIGKIWRDMAQ